MKISQKSVEYVILAVVSIAVLYGLYKLPVVWQVLVSIVLLVLWVLTLLYTGSVVRYVATPLLDRIDTEDNRQEFSLFMRVLIWAVLGLVLAFAWSHIAPWTISWPFMFGKIAMAIGWDSIYTSDGVWQWGWMVIFLVGYLLNLFGGWMLTNDSSFEDRFLYRWLKRD